jgi:hypothetical protein
VMSETPAFRHAALASSSSAGWALTGPGGSINFAAETDVTAVDADDFADSEVEVPRPAVLDGPEVHPTKTRDTTTRMAPMRKQRDVPCVPPPVPSFAASRDPALRTNSVVDSERHQEDEDVLCAGPRDSRKSVKASSPEGERILDGARVHQVVSSTLVPSGPRVPVTRRG